MQKNYSFCAGSQPSNEMPNSDPAQKTRIMLDTYSNYAESANLSETGSFNGKYTFLYFQLLTIWLSNIMPWDL